MPTLDELFTHIDDFRRDEALRQFEESVPPPSAPEVLPKKALPSSLLKTPLALLEEGARRIFDCPPTFNQTADETGTTGTIFTLQCKCGSSITEGTAKTKKLAKQIAATKMLHALVDKHESYAERLGLPKCISEAHLQIDSLSTEGVENRVSPVEELEGFDGSTNYIGIVQELIRELKLDMAVYEYREEGPPNDRTFITVCKVGQEKTEGKGKQKKISKSQAAFKMVNVLKQWIKDMEDDLDLGEEPEPETVKQKSTYKKVQEITDPKNYLERLLTDKDKYPSVSTKYKMLPHRCSFGMYQSLLEVFMVAGDESSRLIFPGIGEDEEKSMNDAARSALQDLLLN